MRNLILGLSLSVAFIVGCLVRPLVIPPVKARTNPPKWEYFCVDTSTFVDKKELASFNKAGAAGRDPIGGSDGNWCFKRRLP
jgi:hypothetical protein